MHCHVGTTWLLLYSPTPPPKKKTKKHSVESCYGHKIIKLSIYNWRSERSHSQVIKIEICDIYLCANLPSRCSHRRLAAGWKVAGSSPAVELFFFSLSPFLFFSLSFSSFPLFPPPFPLSPPFLFPLHARSATSMLKHFSSYNYAFLLTERTYS